MPPGAKRRLPFTALSADSLVDTMQDAVRAVEVLSGQEGQEHQDSPLLLNFLLPPSRPFVLSPTPTTPPRRNKRTSSSSISASTSSPPVIRKRKSNERGDGDLDDFPRPYQRLSDGRYTPLDCWNLHGQSHCPHPEEHDTQALDTHPSSTSDYFVSATVTSTSTSTTPSVSATDTLDMRSLPKGWEPKTPRSELYPIPAIVVCSLILAAVIAGVIVLCVLMRLRRKAKIDAADVEGDRDPHAKREKAIVGSDDEDPDDKGDGDEQARIRSDHAVLASSVSPSTKTGRARWRGRLLPGSLRLRRKRRKHSSSVAPPLTRLPATRQLDVDESSDDDGDTVSNVGDSRPGSRLSSRQLSQSHRNATASLTSAPTERRSVNSHPPATSPNTSLTNIDPPGDTGPGGISGREQLRISVVSLGDEDQLPPYPPRSPAYSRDGSVLAGFNAVEIGDADDDAGPSNVSEGHVATDDKSALARLAQRSEPVVLSPSSLSLASSPSSGREMSTTDALIHMNAIVPDEEAILSNEVSAMETTDPGLLEGTLDTPHSRHTDQTPSVTSSVSALSSQPGTASSKLSNNMLPARIPHTTRVLAQPDENDQVPPYEESRTPNNLPEPVIHAATVREYARLASASLAASTAPGLSVLATHSDEPPLLHVSYPPTGEYRTLIGAEEDEDLPSAPPLEDPDEGRNDGAVCPSAPPLDAFAEDEGGAAAPTAPPA